MNRIRGACNTDEQLVLGHKVVVNSNAESVSITLTYCVHTIVEMRRSGQPTQPCRHRPNGAKLNSRSPDVATQIDDHLVVFRQNAVRRFALM